MKEQLDRIEKQLAAIAAHLGIGARGPAAASAGGAVASAADLDGQYGNPEVRKDPKDWTGPSYVGKFFSDCPAEYLDMIASLNEWRAKKDDEAGARGETNAKGKPKDGHFARLDAARARGWAARARAGGTKPKAAPQRRTEQEEDPFGYGAQDDSNLPF